MILQLETMSKTQLTDPEPDEVTANTDDETAAALAAQVELLREENQRLRREYVRARKTEYRQAALGLAACGLAANVGALVFPATRATLFALAGIGLFTAFLTYYLTPERVVAASVGERTYTALAAIGTALVEDLGLQETRIYVPTQAETPADAASVKLFVPQHANYIVPDDTALSSLMVVPENTRARGVALPPTGGFLAHEFEQTMTDVVADTPANLVDQVLEALVEGFELADDAVLEQEPEGAQLTIGIQGSTFGSVDRFDHPIPSFIATVFATQLELPVRMSTVAAEDDRFDYLLTCSWDEDTESKP